MKLTKGGLGGFFKLLSDDVILFSLTNDLLKKLNMMSSAVDIPLIYKNRPIKRLIFEFLVQRIHMHKNFEKLIMSYSRTT
jgi:hypothetical protein